MIKIILLLLAISLGGTLLKALLVIIKEAGYHKKLSDEPETIEKLLQKGDSYKKTDPQKSFQYFYKAAQQGNAEAMRKVGMAYLWQNSGAPFNLEKSAYWLEQAAQRDVAKAMLPLAQYYMAGVVKNEDDIAAKMLLEKAANSNDEKTAQIAKKWLNDYTNVKSTSIGMLNVAIEMGGIPPKD